MIRNRHFYVLVFAIIAALVSACGGGSSGGNTGPVPTTPPAQGTPGATSTPGGPTPQPGQTPTPRPTTTPATTPTPGTTPTPSSASVTATYTLAPNGGTYAIPNCGGINGTATFPSSNAPSGTTFTITNYCPKSAPSYLRNTVLPSFFQIVSGTPVAYVEITAFSSPVTFSALGGSATLNLASGSVPAGQQLYLGACDVRVCNVEPAAASITSVFGPVAYQGTTISLNTQSFVSQYPGGVPSMPSSLSPPVNGHYLSFMYASPFAPEIQSRYTRGFDGRARPVSFIH